MNRQTVSNTTRSRISRESGMTLLEVLLAMVIFVVGMLALASLQGNLTRSSSDSNMRTVAANIAEETIEGMRAFEVINTTAGKKAYDDIVNKTLTVQRGGVDYNVVVDVQPYYFLADRVSVSKTAPTGVTASSFKNADITVSWNPGTKFQIDETTSTSGQLGGGKIAISSIIPSIPSLNNAKVAAEDDGALGYLPVNYTPGARPDIVAIQLAKEKFKESTTPEPIVQRKNELVETWFDVITYTSNSSSATFLRREEFAAISCECTLRAASGSGQDGRQPTVWNGAEYDEGTKVSKQFGESASNQQSQYCDVCCQDHHDTGSGPESYRPLAASFSGDHEHYSRDKGVLTKVNPGKDYIEACRLIRKDGFFRVAQDFNLQSQTAFPEDYLNDVSEVTAYSGYVTAAVQDHFAAKKPWPPHGLTFDGRDVAYPTDLPTKVYGAPTQQLRSRGIYTDEVLAALQNNLDHCFVNYKSNSPVPTPDDKLCFVKNVSSPLEMYPFFDVQLTKLARWSTTRPFDPVDVTNQELATDNTHSRGVAFLAGSKVGGSVAHSIIEAGNVGLISTLPVALEPVATDSVANLYITAGGVVTPPPPVNAEVSGTIGIASGTTSQVPSVEGGGGATCTRTTNVTFTCVIDSTATAPTLTIGNYFTRVKGDVLPLIACSSNLKIDAFSQGSNDASTWTRFILPKTNTTGIIITIVQGSSCPP